MRSVVIAVVTTLLFAATAAAQTPDPRLEALGALTAAQLYTTWRYLDAADSAMGSKKYSAKQVESLMAEASAMTQNVSTFVSRLAKTNITDADKRYFKEAAVILGLLEDQANALKARALVDNKASQAAYAKASQAAWARIKSLLNLK